MKDHGVLFSAPMVRALWRGDKTQTRRLSSSPLARVQPGDRLWVREAIRAEELKNGSDVVHYLADHLWHAIPNSSEGGEAWGKLFHYRCKPGVRPEGMVGATVPAIHMPRWCSRMLLTVTEVRIQALHDITPEDARDEGVDRRSRKVRQMWLYGADQAARDAIYLGACRDEYQDLWDSLHGAKEGESWDHNPEVVALTFSVEKIDIALGKFL